MEWLLPDPGLTGHEVPPPTARSRPHGFAHSADDPKDSPLFRAAWFRRRDLQDRGIAAQTIRFMLKRRLRDVGLPEIIRLHSFRVMVVTDLLSQNVPVEDVQYLAGHSAPSTTQVYDRRARRVTRNIVKRISV